MQFLIKINDLKGRKKFLIHFYLLSKLFLIVLFILIILILIFIISKEKPKKVGVVGVRHEVNIGNNLIKYAISIKLKELGYIPFIIGTQFLDFNISFINQTTNLRIIHNNFSEINKDDYDVLMVNSDQTWRKFDTNFYDYGFLKFAEKWKIKKLVYGASIGYDKWVFTPEEDIFMKNLIKDIKDISVREEGSIKLIEKHLNKTPIMVLDPTLLIDKHYYLDIIKNYKANINFKKEFIFSYNVVYSKEVINAVESAKEYFDFEDYYFELNNTSSIQDFIYYLVKSSAIITNSYHGTIFSIIFNKPFITIYDKTHAIERFNSLANLFGIHDRMFEYEEKIDFYQLIKPLKYNNKILNKLKLRSINFLKNCLKT